MNQKFLKLAQSFAKSIQDTLIYSNNTLVFGQLLTEESDYQNYLQRAMDIYFKNIIEATQYKPNKVIISYPNLLNYVDIYLNSTGKSVHNRKNIWKLLSSTDYEAIDNSFLPYLQSNSGYFRSKFAIAFDDNFFYYLPKPIPENEEGLLKRIYYVRQPLQNDGKYFGFNSEEDICFNDKDFQPIIEIAIKLYKIDDYQEDV